MESGIGETVREPESVIQSRSDAGGLYYRFHAGTAVGGKLLCVVFKARREDAFILTSHLTDGLKRAQARGGHMERSAVKVWYDPGGDYMEVVFEKKAGYFRETEDERVMEKVDTEGNILGFSIMKVSSLEGGPFEVALA